MNTDLRRLLRWLRRAQPPRRELIRAIMMGSVASITSVGLLVGAVGLLVQSARRPGLGAVAGVLIIIEVLAFTRSPLRFAERLSAHRLGFASVTRWRRWLVASVGRWDYSRWRTHSSGDLLERSLRDTDELQDLWLRFALPFINTIVTFVLSDVVIALLPPHGKWLTVAMWYVLIQIVATVLLVSNVGSLVRADRTLRRARGAFQGTLVELSAVTPEFSLLGRESFADERFEKRRKYLALAERLHQRVQQRSMAVPLIAGLVALQILWFAAPQSSPTWLVVVALLAVATADSLASIRLALDTAAAVSGASERLEALDEGPFQGRTPWPLDSTIRADHLRVREDESDLVLDANFVITPGRRVAVVGSSGAGKSTLLRVLCGLDPVFSGEVTIGDVRVRDIDEAQLREMMTYVAAEPGLTRGYARDVVSLGRTSERNMASDLSMLGIETSETTRFEELSRGERQRVALARSLVTSPRVLIADEPTSGLGIDETDRVLELLATHDATIIVATHDERVMNWCDEIYELSNGVLRLLSR
jgi:ABC-type transport system involved in cytochrome bd biosynthesis fused ATPase/permease subunit